jgi:DNA-binding NtrC family response regulator
MTAVLLVEDDAKLQANLLFQLRQEGYAPRAVGSGEEALALLLERGRALPELLLLDIRLPGISGIDVVRRLREADRLPPTLVVSGEASLTEAVEAVRLGVLDFVEKPFSKERLLRSMANVQERVGLRRQVDQLRGVEGVAALVGESPAMAQLRRAVERAAPTEGRVLILGETGTGKELVASALHHASRRRDRPFIRLNCAALPETLVEGELFGHARGAFTDARENRAGLFEAADGGTLFLDEIGDMPPGLQGRLLRVLEDGRVRRLGETRDRQVDVRVLAATHRELEAEVRAGTFRQDLFFRLAHLPLQVPPLRQREGDVPRLFQHFLDGFCLRHRSRPRRVEANVFAVLERYPWPGNVRELKHLCERLVIFGGDPVTVDQLPAALQNPRPPAASGPPAAGVLDLSGGLPRWTLRELRGHCEREYVEAVLQRTGWNVAAAARWLGLKRPYLHEKLQQLGLKRPR